MTENKQVTRETVTVGLDFRPIPIDLGDGTVWLFQPDPSPTAWGVLMDALTAFSTVDTESETPDLSGLTVLVENLSVALSGLLTTPKQAEKYSERGYGLVAQQRLATVLIETVSGFPTQSPSTIGADSN